MGYRKKERGHVNWSAITIMLSDLSNQQLRIVATLLKREAERRKWRARDAEEVHTI